VAAALAQATAEGQAIEAWQVQIQQHQVVGTGLQHLPGHLAVAGLIAGVAPGLHQLLQGGLDQGIVLHHQHLHGSCGLSSPPP
jgi:hypothetical protein